MALHLSGTFTNGEVLWIVDLRALRCPDGLDDAVVVQRSPALAFPRAEDGRSVAIQVEMQEAVLFAAVNARIRARENPGGGGTPRGVTGQVGPGRWTEYNP